MCLFNLKRHMVNGNTDMEGQEVNSGIEIKKYEGCCGSQVGEVRKHLADMEGFMDVSWKDLQQREMEGVLQAHRVPSR